MNGIIMAIAAVKAVILILGSGITYIAFKAYRRSNDPSIGVLGIGFGVITVGAFLSGVANQFYSVTLETGVLFNSVFVAIGLAVILYSLYMQRHS
ncbi:DUF7521 family protein [Halohasta litorea]|jgi:hypothetical protein|uniref:Uncharacterized protein n=1 Tax=Halohasta litorea TaxID=869891 RepID=A0ABD6DFD5_9EURY|nr:hypothetical protein [Halohasta litorea]